MVDMNAAIKASERQTPLKALLRLFLVTFVPLIVSIICLEIIGIEDETVRLSVLIPIGVIGWISGVILHYRNLKTLAINSKLEKLN